MIGSETHPVFGFKMSEGQMYSVGIAEPIENPSVVHTDKEDGTDFYSVPMLRQKVIRRIEQAVRAQFGDGVCGTGYYHTRGPCLEFAPDKEGGR
jgi:hypothetical protein